MYNQFPVGIRASSTITTDPIYFNGQFYPNYPHIGENDIGINTSSLFVDTLRISNLLLEAIGGDYDGDQVSVKGVFTKEANEECMRHMYNKFNYIGMDSRSIRTSTHESVQAIYTLTMQVKGGKKLTKPVF